MKNFQDKVSFIWTIAELLRGPYKPEEYGKVVLPLCVLRRFDCILDVQFEIPSDATKAVEQEWKEKIQNWRKKSNKNESEQPTVKEMILEEYQNYKELAPDVRNKILQSKFGLSFINVSNFDFEKLITIDFDSIDANLQDYINGFSKDAYEIIEYFDFGKQIEKMERNGLLFLVIQAFKGLDLHPSQVSNIEMGYIFEELIRRFSEQGEAGDHYTPREVIKLMINLLFMEDEDVLIKPGIVQSIYDCCAGTGGMGSVAQEYIQELNPTADVKFFAQEINEESYAICKADILIKGQSATNIRFGNTLSDDQFKDDDFDYMITNPPYGVEWKPAEKAVKAEHNKGYLGRFGAGLPRISDGQLLFLQHLVSKMKPVTEENPKGSRIAIIMNGSPMFTGDAGSGESDIRKYLFENDLVEGIVGLPEQLFYNTGISTYIWILSNKKSPERKGKVQLVNAVDFYQRMRKSLGSKRNEISKEQIDEIIRIYGSYKEGDYCKIFDNEDFGYKKIVVERPLRLSFQFTQGRIEQLWEQKAFQNLASSRKQSEAGQQEIEQGKKTQKVIIDVLTSLIDDIVYKNHEEFTKLLKKKFKEEKIKMGAPVLKAILTALGEKDKTADICFDSKGKQEPDTELRDTENVPLKEDIQLYMEREVLPHVPEGWVDESKAKIGYEIPFTRHFYEYTTLRSSSEIVHEIQSLEQMIFEQLKKVIV
ncbi:class I SAM-dependent DNA methyltransferase [Bacillus sp. MYb56]|uniref:type I restriction-modification system subunit M n=1 Tax=Bacillus sp. MYb56 TaxID=1827287 RepID=UPI001C6167D0|nr:class I SAM-dependent DNA methyltransferase [Bacillus sp. MYb56]